MKVLVIIGGMGSGKSTVSRLLAEHGAPVLDLDKVGHEALCDPTVKKALVEVFGDAILSKQGDIMRKALAAKAFVSDTTTRQLTAITAPAILARAAQWLAVQNDRGQERVIVEVSAYDGPEGCYAKMTSGAFDFLLVAVIAPFEERLSRAKAKGFEPDDIRLRMAQQPTDEERQKWADYSIDNNGSEAELQIKVENLWRTINS